MRDFIQNNLISIIVALWVLGGLLFLWLNGKRDEAKRIIFVLVCQAEQAYGSNTGPIKLEAVWAGIYEKLPWIVRLFFPKKTLEEWIEEGVKKLKMELQKPNTNLLSYSQEREKQTITNITQHIRSDLSVDDIPKNKNILI